MTEDENLIGLVGHHASGTWWIPDETRANLTGELTDEQKCGVCRAGCCRDPKLEIEVNMHAGEPVTLMANAKLFGLKATIRPVGRKWVLERGPDGVCVFLDQATNRCRIYAARPDACRRFPHRPFRGCLIRPGDANDPEVRAA